MSKHTIVSGCGLGMQELTRSDSDSSQEGLAQEAAPVLYRLRADGRKVPITDGHGVELARRKGLIQEVEVSPKRASQGQARASSAFGNPQTTQPETVVLHSVELPQVQLGDREIADTPPEKAAEEATAKDGKSLTKSLNLSSHPSLVQLQRQQQQERQQSQATNLMTECGLEPRSDSLPTARSSQSLSSSQVPQATPDLTSLNSSMTSFPPHPTQEMAGSRSGSLAAATAVPPGYMPWWGLTNSSAPLPNQATALAQASRSLPQQHSPSMGHYAAGIPSRLGHPGAPFEGMGQVRTCCLLQVCALSVHCL